MSEDLKKLDGVLQVIANERHRFVKATSEDNTKEALFYAVKIAKYWIGIVDELQVKHALEKTND